MAPTSSIRLMVVSPLRGAVSETFIRAHAERLPFSITPRFDAKWRLQDGSGSSVIPYGAWLGPVLQRLMPRMEGQVLDRLLAWHLRRTGVDAVLAEYGTTGAYLARACEMARVPLFVHFHGFDASDREVLKANETAYRQMFALARGIVVVSSAMRHRLLVLGAPAESLHLNPYGVDPDEFEGSEPSQTGPCFLAVGRFVEKKAPHLTIVAFAKVVQEVPDARLVMVGDGALLGPCKRLAHALGVGESVEFLGAQGPDVVRRAMKESRAFVQHSLEALGGDSEGTPVAIIEAQMSGLPVVSTKHAGIPDVVVDGETGFLVDEGEANEMGVKMTMLARQPDLAGKMGRAARARALEHFTLDRHLGQLSQMFEAGIARARVG